MLERSNVQLQQPRLFAHESGRLVEVLSSTDDTVEFSPQGGGFILMTPRSEFEKLFKPAQVNGVGS